MDPLSQALLISQLVTQIITQLLPLGVQAFQAATIGDQAALDALHKQVIAASDALKPAGEPAIPVA